MMGVEALPRLIADIGQLSMSQPKDLLGGEIVNRTEPFGTLCGIEPIRVRPKPAKPWAQHEARPSAECGAVILIFACVMAVIW